LLGCAAIASASVLGGCSSVSCDPGGTGVTVIVPGGLKSFQSYQVSGACPYSGFGTCAPQSSGSADGGAACALEVAIPAVGGSSDVCHITVTSTVGAVFHADVQVVFSSSTVGDCTSAVVRLADPSQQTITVVFPAVSVTDGGVSDARPSSG